MKVYLVFAWERSGGSWSRLTWAMERKGEVSAGCLLQGKPNCTNWLLPGWFHATRASWEPKWWNWSPAGDWNVPVAFVSRDALLFPLVLPAHFPFDFEKLKTCTNAERTVQWTQFGPVVNILLYFLCVSLSIDCIFFVVEPFESKLQKNLFGFCFLTTGPRCHVYTIKFTRFQYTSQWVLVKVVSGATITLTFLAKSPLKITQINTCLLY